MLRSLRLALCAPLCVRRGECDGWVGGMERAWRRDAVRERRVQGGERRDERGERGERREESGLPVPRTAKCRILWILCRYLRCKYLGYRYLRA